MKICLNTYALYNDGFVNVQWFNLEDYEKAIEHIKEVQDQQLSYPQNDYEIYVGDVEDDDLDLIEQYGIDFFKIREIQNQYDNLSESEQLSVQWLIERNGLSIEEALEKYENVTCYENMTMKDVAWEATSQQGILNFHLTENVVWL
jgi:hypothetical protein